MKAILLMRLKAVLLTYTQKIEQETNYESMQADLLLAIDINPNYAKKNNWYWPNYLIVQFRKIYDGPMNMFQPKVRINEMNYNFFCC